MSAKLLGLMVVTILSLGCTPHSEESPAAAAPAPTPTASPAAPAAPVAATPMPDPATSVAGSPAPAAVAPAAPVPPAANPAAQPFTPPQQPVLPSAAVPVAGAAGAGAPVPGATEQVTAKAGEGLKGQSLKNESGVFVEAAKAYFNVQQRVVFEMEIPKALQLHKALEGQAPKTHDEFMNKIISANQIKLPQLPAGSRYIYDPQREELMVEKPVSR